LTDLGRVALRAEADRMAEAARVVTEHRPGLVRPTAAPA
jgi:hypothetical protein